MRRIKLLKTKTLGLDEPSVTICPGHVDVEEFNKASAREGWNDFPEGLGVDAEGLTHTYYRKIRRKRKTSYVSCKKEDKGARPFTENLW